MVALPSDNCLSFSSSLFFILKEAVETILKDAMIHEADQRYWRARGKNQAPIIRAWRWADPIQTLTFR